MQTLLLSEVTFGANRRGIILFGFEIYYYAICIVCGILLATFLSALLMKRRNMSTDFIFTLFIFCIPTALICARLYYCFTKPLPPSQWINVRDGGLSVIGGVIGGVTAGLVVCLVKKVDFFRAADCVVVTILVAQALGRLGNYFNQEVFGQPVTDPAWQWEPFAVYISAGNNPGAPAGWYHAFCFYEMFVNLIGFGLLYSAAWFWKKKPNGILTFSYFLWYGIVRAVMEPFRYEADILNGGGIMWSELTAVLYIGLGVCGILLLLIFNYKKEGAFIGSKTGDPCGITNYLTPYKNDEPYFSKINMFGKNYPPKPEKGKGSALKRHPQTPTDTVPTETAPTESAPSEQDKGEQK